METIPLYTANEFKGLFDFENSFEWLDLGGETLVLVEADRLLPAEVTEAVETVNTFSEGNGVSIHPWDLAASGLFPLPKRFILRA